MYNIQNLSRGALMTAALWATLFLGGCSEFFDINSDPNNPTEVGPQLLLPSAEHSMAGYFGGSTVGLSWPTSIYTHQYVTRSSGFTDYSVTGDNFSVNRPWQGLYANTLVEYQTLIDQSEENGNRVYAGVAKILKAFTYSIMVDIWGNVPFSDALLGGENTDPPFTGGEEIYPQLFDMIDAGIADVESGEGLPIGSDDFFYEGDPEKWVRFANALKLRLYNQIRLVQDVSGDINALIDGGNLMGPGDDFEFPYGTNNNPDNRNPSFVKEYGGNPTYISPYFYEILTGQSDENPILNGLVDPRIPYYFYNQLEPGEDAQNPESYRDGGFLSIWMFSFNIDPNEGFDQAQSQAVPGLYPVGGKYDDGSGNPVGINSGSGDVAHRMFPYFNHLYIRAELAQEGITSENARDLLEMAIQASFAKVNEVASDASAPQIGETAVDDYLDEVLTRYDEGTEEEKLEMIMTQKWIANFGWGIDSYNDFRRTGYPQMFDGNTDNNPFTVRGREYPLSFPYQTDELNLNSNAPRQRVISQDRVFWDQ